MPSPRLFIRHLPFTTAADRARVMHIYALAELDPSVDEVRMAESAQTLLATFEVRPHQGAVWPAHPDLVALVAPLTNPDAWPAEPEGPTVYEMLL
jgi:hypothetical protein